MAKHTAQCSTQEASQKKDDEEDTDDVLLPETNPDKQEYDDRIVQKTAHKALDEMALKNVVPTQEQRLEGQSLMPKLQEQFEQLSAKNATSNQRMLTERVDTRWDTNYDCLESHIHFKLEAQLLTGDSSLKLKSYTLSEAQYALADEMLTVLEILKELTKRFSLTEVPLLHNTLPELALMRSELESVCNDSDDMSPLTRVAARAAILVYDKYVKKMTTKSEMYYIAVAMCPTLKLKWFSDNGYSFNEIQKIRNLVIGRFYDSYTAESSQDELLLDSKHTIEPNHLHPTKASTNMLILGVNLTFIAQRVNKYLHKHNVASAQPLSPVQDSIEQYLTDEVVPKSMIAQHGGMIQYCHDLTRFQ
ncbi:hypothetical protein FRC09_018659 [Ceratobasidium sp. 395]|nr:hypothetical protein FRC09_018659 [Ceratobasidium sp. 395]